VFGKAGAEAALDVLVLMEYAWHDCYGESTPSDDVVEAVLLCSQGRLDLLAKAALLAVVDRRDLWMWAHDLKPRR
jgi:hypothetical protein